MLERINFKRVARKNVEYEIDPVLKTAKAVSNYKNDLVKVIIPEFIKYRFRKYKVTSIEYGAFQSCINLISINIPNSVTSIGDFAFQECYGLTSITIPNSVTSIGEGAFANCSSLTSVTIPDSVTSIGDYAFYDCTSLTSVDIPNSVTHIRDCAFDNCISLTSIIIPDNITSIGDCAFYNCISLTSIIIPDNITSIGDRAFYNIGLTLPKRYTEDGRLIAYKAFNADMTCRDFQYKEGKSFEIEGEISLCEKGFHACTNPLDVFNYYFGKIGKDIVIHEVYLSGEIDEDNEYDSKVCSSNIEIGRRLTMKDINEIINNK